MLMTFQHDNMAGFMIMSVDQAYVFQACCHRTTRLVNICDDRSVFLIQRKIEYYRKSAQGVNFLR